MNVAARLSAPMSPRVCLLHNYQEGRHLSMKLYAEQFGDALERAGAVVERVRQDDVLPASWQRLPLLQKADSYLGRFGSYPRRARGLRADIFHIVDHGQAHLIKSLDPARTVVTCHDLILLVLGAGELGRAPQPRIATLLLRYAVGHLARAAKIVAVSQQTRADLGRFLGIDPARVEVIYPGLNRRYRPMENLRDATRARHGLPPTPLLLHVGSSVFYKNLEGCLHVVARLRAGGIPATLVRVGQRLQPAQLRLAGQLGLQDSIRELGSLTSPDLAELYNSVDLLLFPSHYEGFGWPPVEAMASGTPVVCSSAGSLREIVGDAALTADADDIAGLAEHVSAVLTKADLRANLRDRGLTRAALFDWDKTAAKFLRIYGDVLQVGAVKRDR